MAVPGNQDLQNRRNILQDLQQKKQQLLSQQQTQGPGAALASSTSRNTQESTAAVSSSTPRSNPAGDMFHQMTANQRAALEHALSISHGYFIPQDSVYGNLILPVLPRVEPDNTTG